MLPPNIFFFSRARRASLRQLALSVDWRMLVAFGLPFGLYVLTLAPTVYNLDSAEFTTAAATGGLVRATGYPLYLLLGRAWVWLPIGDVGYRLNLFSAFCGALTVLLVDVLLRRLEVGRWAAFGALGLLATALHFWALSLIAEVYTLHTVLMAALTLTLVWWSQQPSPGRLALAGLLVGLGLSHHLAMVLLVPGCVWYVIVVARRQAFAPRMMLAAAAGVLLGLTAYLYLPWRWGAQPAFNYAGSYDASGAFHPVNLRSLEGMWWLISGRTFSAQMFAYQGAALWHEMRAFGAQLWAAFFAVGIGPGLLGMALLLRRDWRLGGMLLLMFAVSAFFYIDYRVVDKDTMFLPTYLIWAVWLGIGYQWLLNWVRTAASATARRWGDRLVRGALAAAVLGAMAWNWPLVDLSDDWSARLRGERVLHNAEPNALVLGWWDTVPVVEYLLYVEGERPDVQAINRFLIPYGDLVELIRRESAHRPVYIDELPLELSQTHLAEPAGPLFRVRPRASGE